MILKKIKSLTLLLIIVVAFFDNSAKAQTFPLTNLIVHGWQKIDVLPYGVADTTIYKSVIWNKNNGKLYKIGTMGGGGSVDSLFISYCCGCNMVDGWKALEDTIKIDTCYVNQIIKDSLSNHLVLINKLDTGKVSTSGDIMYGGLNIKQGNLSVKGTFNVGNVPLGTDIDSVTVIENGQLKSVDGSSFKPDSTSAGCFNNFYYKQITGCDNDNLYLKADTTTISADFKLGKFSNPTTEPVLKVLASGRIDTNETRSIMGTYLDSLDVGEIDVTTLNSFTSNITNANITTSIEQNLVLPNLGSNNKPVLSVSNLSGDIDTTQVMIITETTLDSLKIDKYVVIGGVKSEDKKFTLADDGVYSFAETSYGVASLYSYNAGKMTSFVRYTFDSDGTIYMETSTPLVNGADADGYEICLYYSAGSYNIKNTSGGSRTYLLTQKK